MIDRQETLRRAISLHRGGNLRAAQQLYQQLLALNPNHADALQLLSAIAHPSAQHAQLWAQILAQVPDARSIVKAKSLSVSATPRTAEQLFTEARTYRAMWHGYTSTAHE